VPVFGQGVIPAAGSTANELSAFTRRAFVPYMYVQLYNSSPFMATLLANSQYATGGVSSVTVPVQGASLVAGGWSDYSGTFQQPANLNGGLNLEFNLKLFITPIPFLGMEGAVQMDHAIIPLIKARMNDSTNFAMDTFSSTIFNNTGSSTPTYGGVQGFIGLPAAIDDGTNQGTYGNQSRTTNTWLKSKVYAAGSVNPTRQNVLQYIAGVCKLGGEMPTMGVMGLGTWALLAQDFQATEQIMITPGNSGFDDGAEGPRSAFRGLLIAGVPIFADPYCPEGTLYLINDNYLNLYVHKACNFAFTGFESTLSNWQVGYVGAVLTLAELVSAKPKTMGRVGSYNYLSI
jgi:hypothetical protein